MKKLYTKIVGDPSVKILKKIQPTVDQINKLEEEYQKLSDSELQAKTEEFKERLSKGEKLDDLLPEAYAVVKNACRRLCGTKYKLAGEEQEWFMIPFDVQLKGGVVLHQGKIAEMKTGEGKTLVCTMPVYLNALQGKGVHVITVNDYLAKRDSEWMGIIYKYLGMSVGVVLHGLSTEERREAYNSDITYGTNNEFGFDYLRDNMVGSQDQMVQRALNYAIVDEVDSILIDEARTPLIISAPAEESTNKYYKYAQLIPQLKENVHFNVDEKMKAATLTEEGVAKMEDLLGMKNIYTEAGFAEVHHIEQALKAHALFQKDTDYIVKEGEVIIVDEFTGRLMEGRRYSEGLHQAIEAKEDVEVKRESRTLATITFQNYFRLFDKLAGMTGTAITESEEFYKIYGLDVIEMPTNMPLIRNDMRDVVYKTERGKFMALVKEIERLYQEGQPILVGTISIEKSEVISKLLKDAQIPHRVLNAKHHEKEAEIITRAGQRGSVTIATNMAGRGTDIKLGEGVQDLGGLHIMGTERHESRRIDNQLRGRSGRQGDPGSTQFFISLEDDVMRLFGGDRVKKMMDAMGLAEDQAIENRMISRSIESAQKRVEGRNFDIRKHVLEYDDVMNKHREIIYSRRRKILETEDMKDEIVSIITEEIELSVDAHINAKNREIDLKEIQETMHAIHRSDTPLLANLSDDDKKDPEKIKDSLVNTYLDFYEEKEKEAPAPEVMRRMEKAVYLRSIDNIWMEHLDNMTHLREKVALSGYAQRDPLLEYKQEAYFAFQKILGTIQTNTVNTIYKVRLVEVPDQPVIRRSIPDQVVTNEGDIEAQSMGAITPVADQSTARHTLGFKNTQPGPEIKTTITEGAKMHTATTQATSDTVGRNDPCPCGSGKKYKKCHGR